MQVFVKHFSDTNKTTMHFQNRRLQSKGNEYMSLSKIFT